MSDETLAHRVQARAAAAPDAIGFTFLADGAADARSINWSQLHERAANQAASLLARRAEHQPVLLALGSGLAFVEALFACWYAGAIAVPVCLPRHTRVKHRLDHIIAGANARFAVGSDEIRQRFAADPAAGELQWVDLQSESQCRQHSQPRAKADDIAVLQFTSGSTGTPRGVMVTHANLIHNSRQIAEVCRHDAHTTIGGWLPIYHDMGLVGLLQGAFSGARCVFMQPERFLMRPASWLQMISDYRIRSSPAPNFAYDLCVERVSEDQKRSLDLSCWQNALNGAEPVRAATLDRFARAFASCGFSPRAFFPCYGLAEATLFVTGPSSPRRAARRNSDGSALPDHSPAGHVACGRPRGDTRIAIVDPETRRRLADESIGEIWISGRSCAKGYWNNPQATAETFHARLDEPKEASTHWLRTGDLGMIAEGELFITGRLRDLIIIAGRNLFPVDLERTAETADAAIVPFGVAAISADISGMERLILLAEIRREFTRPAGKPGDSAFDAGALVRRLRAAVAAEHDVAAHEIVLLSAGSLPRTTSGKLSRSAARESYLNGTLQRLEIVGDVHASV